MWYWIEIFGAAGAGLSIIGGLYWAGAWLSVSRRILERVPEKELSAYLQRRGRISCFIGVSWLAVTAAALWLGLPDWLSIIFYLTVAAVGIWRICCCNMHFTGFYTLL